MAQNYRGLFDGWEIAVAKRLVGKRWAQCEWLQQDDFDDLLRDCLDRWLSVKDRYDPGRKASRRTFMASVIRNKLNDLVRERKADVRRAIYEAESMDAPVGAGEDGSETTLHELIGSHAVPNAQKDPLTLVPLRIDLSRILSGLTQRQTKICLLLGEGQLNIAAASRCLKTPRTTLVDEIRRIRAIFEKAGLRDYLEERPDTFRR